MGIIIREFLCHDCGQTFESSDPVEEVACPHCSAGEPERVFLTPPAIRSSDTTRKDTIVKELAADYGLSNVSNKYGEAVKRAKTDTPAPPQFATGTPTGMQMLERAQRAGADNFSGVLPSLQASGRPNQWAKVPAKR